MQRLLWGLHFADTTRPRQTRPWVVSFSILGRFGPRGRLAHPRERAIFTGRGDGVELICVASAQTSIQEAKRRVELEKQQRRDAIEAKGKDEAAREAWLSKREDAVTSPRTKARRKLLRLLYKATRRQNQGYVICEWGCGQWC